MVVSKQPMPAYIEAALPELIADLVEYLELEECDDFPAESLTLAGYFAAGPEITFVVYEFTSEDEPGIAAIKLNPRSQSFQDACVFRWGRDETESVEDALGDFLKMNPQ